MSKRAAANKSLNLKIDAFPGHGIRRLQQVAVAVFMQEAQASGVTPPQFAVLQTLGQRPGIDQRTLADEVGLDRATIGGVIDRLEARALLTRSLTAEDRRVRLLTLTDDGEALLRQLLPQVERAQQRMLDPLTARERQSFIRLLKRLLEHHERPHESGESEP